MTDAGSLPLVAGAGGLLLGAGRICFCGSIAA